MEYVLLAGAAVGAGIYYLFRQHWQEQHPVQPHQAQTGARVESEEVPVDFGKYRVSLGASPFTIRGLHPHYHL